MAGAIAISGLPRSGTTYLGRILEESGQLEVFQEPWNPEFGLRSVEGDFPFADGGDEDALLDQLVRFGGSWRRLPRSRGVNRSGARKAAKLLVGSESSWRWRRARAMRLLGRDADRRVCFKDPFLTFSTRRLAERHRVPSVVMVRHPGGYAASYRAKPWVYGLGRLCDDRLRQRYLGDVPESQIVAAETDVLVYCGLLWKAMARHQLDCEHPQVLTVLHEDLSLHGEKTVAQACDHLGLSFSTSVQEFLRKSSSGTEAGPQEKVHAFVRDSAAVVDHWRGDLSSTEQERLADVVGKDLEIFYDRW